MKEKTQIIIEAEMNEEQREVLISELTNICECIGIKLDIPKTIKL
jgi:hypothetical protein